MTGHDIYRSAPLPETPAPPPRELVYEAFDRERNRGIVVVWFQLFSLPVVFGVAISTAISPAVGLMAMIGGGCFSVWYRRRAARREGAVLRVEEGELHVLSRDGRGIKGRMRLRELTDVVLDVKTIRRVQDGASAIPAVRFTDTTVGPEVDTARIVLVAHGNSRVELTQAYLAHMDATEWLGKIRVFLRKHGWMPEDEREAAKSEPVDDAL
ncbi:MAG TPA: hypothetical protein VM925_02085 [Labilithrix sp.]|nr:hypothetical protein [Labilithrix sp.]